MTTFWKPGDLISEVIAADTEPLEILLHLPLVAEDKVFEQQVLLLTAQIEAGSLVMEGKKKLMVGVPKKCGTTDFFVDLKLDSKNKSQVEKAQGYSIDIFNATIAYLQNVSVEYVACANEDGSCVENYDAILDHLSETKYDVVVGDVTILAKRSNYVDFTGEDSLLIEHIARRCRY
ncbi:hypothetical protein K1719_011825 [Acacia pycnantha]|nr:hypothetical protein K1719_011825 [Acacia pycnantha]